MHVTLWTALVVPCSLYCIKPNLLWYCRITASLFLPCQAGSSLLLTVLLILQSVFWCRRVRDRALVVVCSPCVSFAFAKLREHGLNVIDIYVLLNEYPDALIWKLLSLVWSLVGTLCIHGQLCMAVLHTILVACMTHSILIQRKLAALRRYLGKYVQGYQKASVICEIWKIS